MQAPDGSQWEVLGDLYSINPRFLLSEDDYDMLRLWQMFQSSFGAGHLPEGGGVMDQPALMLDAYAAMSAAYNTLSK